MIQAGGINGDELYPQYTYHSQVQSANNHGLRAHTYLWYQVGASKKFGKKCMDYWLPKIETSKGSIVALDYENGASGDKEGNTDAIIYGMNRIAEAGYTPMYYSYRPYTLAHVDYQRILSQYPNSLWIAGYPSNNVAREADFNWFPSMPGIAIWQFTSTNIQGGLDANVDLTGITHNGYNGNNIPTPKPKPAPVKPVSGWVDSLGDRWYSESGTYTLNYNTWLLCGAKTSSNKITLLTTGSKIKYDAFSLHDGYVWLRQPRENGYAYIASGEESNGKRTSYYGSFS